MPLLGTRVCVDVREHAISVIAVRGGTVRSWASMEASHDILTDESPAAVEQMAGVLRRRLEEWGIRSARGAIAIPDGAVMMRAVQLPAMPDSDLRRAARYSLDRELPLPAHRAERSWAVAGRRADAVDLILAGAWADVVSRYVELGRLAGLDVRRIEPRSVCIARALHGMDAVLLETSNRRLQGIHVGALPAVTESVPFTDTPSGVRQAVDDVLLSVTRRLSGRAAKEAPSVVVAGDLEPVAGTFGFVAARAADCLNGAGPRRPPGFPAGSYLANLGLAMEEKR